MPLTASHTGLTGSNRKPPQVKPCCPQLAAWGRWMGQLCLGHQSLIWLSLNKPGQAKETLANYYPLKLLEFSKSVKGHLKKQVRRQIWGTVRSGWVQLGRHFSDLGLQPTRMAPKDSSPPSPHLDRWKADPNLKHSDGQNVCNWELVTPRQGKTQKSPRDKICLKILTPPHFFTCPFQEIVGPNA